MRGILRVRLFAEVVPVCFLDFHVVMLRRFLNTALLLRSSANRIRSNDNAKSACTD